MGETKEKLEVRAPDSPSIIARAEENMGALGIGYVWAGSILCASNIEEAGLRIRDSKAPTSSDQLLSYAFPALYKMDETVCAAAQKALSPIIEGWGLPDDFIDSYVSWTEAGPMKFNLDYPDIWTRERNKALIEALRDFAYVAVRNYLRGEKIKRKRKAQK